MKDFKKILICTLFLSFTFNAFSQPSKEKIEVTKLAESIQSWNGDKLPSYPTGQPKITILKIIIPPHQKLDLHKHLVINAGILLKGVLTVFDEKNNMLELKAGDSIIELVNKYHYGENKGDEPAEIMVFYAGVVGTPITVKK
ncbi:MAG: cupin domain-containing protein [Oligoflexus sp.]|nr:cupin domain-containing protein [Pseudopedobacter sp.]